MARKFFVVRPLVCDVEDQNGWTLVQFAVNLGYGSTTHQGFRLELVELRGRHLFAFLHAIWMCRVCDLGIFPCASHMILLGGATPFSTCRRTSSCSVVHRVCSALALAHHPGHQLCRRVANA